MGENERMCGIDRCSISKRFPPPDGLELGTLDQQASSLSSELPGSLDRIQVIGVA